MTARPAVGGFVLALTAVAAVVFAGVAVHELNYASDYPNAYGPAKVSRGPPSAAPHWRSPSR